MALAILLSRLCGWAVYVASGIKHQSKYSEENSRGPWVVCLYPEIDVWKKHCKYREGKVKGKWRRKRIRLKIIYYIGWRCAGRLSGGLPVTSRWRGMRSEAEQEQEMESETEAESE